MRLALQAAAVLLLAALIGLFARSLLDGSTTVTAELNDGQRPAAPNFTLPSLTGRGDVSLASYRGKIVILNFWASWCPPCQSETPVLRDVADEFRDQGLVVIGISVQETSPENVAAYVARYQLDYVVAADSTGQIFRRYGPRGLPTSIFIGPEGAVRSFVLAPLSRARAEAQVRAILPGAGSSDSPSPSGSGAAVSPVSSPSPAP